MYRQEGNKVYRKIFDGERFVTQVKEFNSEEAASDWVESNIVEPNTIYVS